MSILPKLLYLFRALPLYVSCQTLVLIQQDINTFIWNNNYSRYGKLLTHRPMPQGGLGLPDVWLYYLTARLAQTAQWHATPDRIPWLQFEITSVRPFYIHLWQVSPNPREIGALNNIVGQTIHVWSLYHQKFKLCSYRPP